MGRISFRLNEKEDALIRAYVRSHDIGLSSFIRQTILEKIEDEYDTKLFDKVWAEEQDQKRVSHDDLKKELVL